MATIRKIEGKTGTSYLIRSSCGYDVSGKQVMRSMTWRPTPGMTAAQIRKELNRQSVLFDEKCAAQGVGNGNVKFEVFARQWFTEYAEHNLRPVTLERLHQQEARTYKAIGHIRLDKLTARHIQRFVDSLGEEGVSSVLDRAHPKAGFSQVLKERGLTQKALAAASGVSPNMISKLCHGQLVTLPTATKVSKALGMDMKALFTIQRADGKLSGETIKQYFSFVSAVLSYAVKIEAIPNNPCRRVDLPPLEREAKEVYTLEEAQHFLDSLEAAPMRYQTFFTLAMYSGLRRGELLGLEWQDIDFEAHTIDIKRSSLYTKEKGIFTAPTKTKGSTRIIKLPAEIFDLLRRHRADQAQQRLLLGDRWEAGDRLFTSPDGKLLHPSAPRQWLAPFCKETGQRCLGVHVFRHLNASLLIGSGTDARTVSAMLGHSQTSTTLNLYAHSFAAQQARASEAVADLLRTRKAK